MTRNIDFSQPLDEDEQLYVADRPWLLQDARLRGEDIINDDEFVVEDEDAEDTSGEEPEGDEGDEEDGIAPYIEWDYADLKNEAKRRELSQAGSKEQLITRLEQDDDSAPE